VREISLRAPLKILIFRGALENKPEDKALEEFHLNPNPSLEIYIIRLSQENTRLNQNFLVRTYQVISLRLKNPASPFIFLAKPNSVKFLMTDLG